MIEWTKAGNIRSTTGQGTGHDVVKCSECYALVRDNGIERVGHGAWHEKLRASIEDARRWRPAPKMR